MRKNASIIGVAAGILCLIMVGATYAAVKFYTRPQAPTLSLATVTQTTAPATPLSPKATATSITIQETPTATPTQLPQVCGQTGSWILLILGRTIHLDPAPAQMIRLVKADFDQKEIVIYSLPPDLVLETPGLTEKYKIQTSRLQDIFTALVIKDGESRQTAFNATQATAQVILDNFGIAADHYITLKEDFVIEIVDLLGGIDVTLARDFTLPDYSKYKGKVLTAGKQHIDGETVHALTTFRTGATDEFLRLSRQNEVLEGMRLKLLDPSVYVKIPQLYSIYKEHLITDLSLEQIAALSCLTRLVPPEKIQIETPDVEQIIIQQDGAMFLKDSALFVKEIQTLFEVP